MLARLEVRVREAEEEVRELAVREIVGQEFHRVGAQGRDVLVRPWRGGGGGGGRILRAQGCDAVRYVVEHLDSEFHACYAPMGDS